VSDVGQSSASATTGGSGSASHAEPVPAFTIYVTGSTAYNNATVQQFRHFCAERLEQLGQEWVLEVVDLHDDPVAARRHGVFVTPTVVVQMDGDTKKLVGDFGDSSAVAQQLGLS